MLEYMDDVLGRLFDYMASSPLRDNTYVMVMSDNGAELFGGELPNLQVRHEDVMMMSCTLICSVPRAPPLVHPAARILLAPAARPRPPQTRPSLAPAPLDQTLTGIRRSACPARCRAPSARCWRAACATTSQSRWVPGRDIGLVMCSVHRYVCVTPLQPLRTRWPQRLAPPTDPANKNALEPASDPKSPGPRRERGRHRQHDRRRLRRNPHDCRPGRHPVELRKPPSVHRHKLQKPAARRRCQARARKAQDRARDGRAGGPDHLHAEPHLLGPRQRARARPRQVRGCHLGGAAMWLGLPCGTADAVRLRAPIANRNQQKHDAQVVRPRTCPFSHA